MNRTRSIQIFKNPFLERCTHVHPLTPLIIWGPFIGTLLWNSPDLSLPEWILCPLAGLLFWTLTEYLLHRFVFHFPARSKTGKSLILLFHGHHHNDPSDPTRLVMPPLPAIIFTTIFYFIFKATLPDRFLFPFMAFFMIGYLMYDYIHYASHHFQMKFKPGNFLKHHHLLHHFSDQTCRFGVSSPLWDYVFGTFKPK